MFRKRSMKNHGAATYRARKKHRDSGEEEEDDDDDKLESREEGVGVSARFLPALKRRRGAEYRTRDEIEEEEKDDDSVDGAWKSSRSVLPMQHRGGAFEMNEIDTAPEHDFRSKLQRKLELDRQGQTSAETKMYHGSAGYKSYVKTTEDQVRAGKYTGTKGPVRAPQFLRTTCRFDYQPDICKDYKETGYCGYGDSCKFLHDRGDYKTGWQLEQEFADKKKREKERLILGQLAALDPDQDREQFIVEDNNVSNDNLPFACHECRGPFRDPMMTLCGHYFCQTCIQTHFNRSSTRCPICDKQTSGVLNRPTKLLAKAKTLGGFKRLYEAGPRTKE